MELTILLKEARSATIDRRIEWRDPIASFGERAILVMQPWLTDPALAAFAIRVIERAGEQGQAELARRALRAARRVVPAGFQGDLEWALGRLRPVRRLTPAKERATKPASRSRIGDRPWYSVVARRRPR